MTDNVSSAKNMEVVVQAKAIHNETCPWGGIAQRILFHPFDLERMGWEEGDVIAGLTVISDTKVNTGMARVECDAEPEVHGATITEAVSTEDLVHV